MKIVSINCPKCGALLETDENARSVVCQYCRSQLYIDDEVKHVKFDNLEQMGYEFEKGRQRAQAEQRLAQNRNQNPQFNNQNRQYYNQNMQYNKQNVNPQKN